MANKMVNKSVRLTSRDAEILDAIAKHNHDNSSRIIRSLILGYLKENISQLQQNSGFEMPIKEALAIHRRNDNTLRRLTNEAN